MGALSVLVSVVVATVAASATDPEQLDQNLTDSFISIVECNQFCAGTSQGSNNLTVTPVQGCQCSSEMKVRQTISFIPSFKILIRRALMYQRS